MEKRIDDKRAPGQTPNGISRRAFLAAGSVALAGIALDGPVSAAAVNDRGFAQRGYYVTFMRMPSYGLAAWKQTIDLFASDGINLLML
ncbi:MAG: hypothetical protein JWN51_2587, partial [Phycisphaerales bacterium]|nr:hypothetical protein [Phycisphaerales bacterium]